MPYNDYKTIISTTLTPIRNINKFPQQQSNFDDIPERVSNFLINLRKIDYQTLLIVVSCNQRKKIVVKFGN